MYHDPEAYRVRHVYVSKDLDDSNYAKIMWL